MHKSLQKTEYKTFKQFFNFFLIIIIKIHLLSANYHKNVQMLCELQNYACIKLK